MNYKVIIYLLVMGLIFSCGSQKFQLKQKGNKDNARKNIILDYLYNYTEKSKEFFFVENFSDTKRLYVFRIEKYNTVKPAPSLTDTIGAYTDFFPTNYYEKDNKLFIWHDKNKRLDKKTVVKMQEYNCIDSLYYKGDNVDGAIIDTGNFQKSLYYFVCKENISKYKKRKAIWIEPKNYPNIKCLK
ncbi:MAG: hypothetical protein V3U80_01930 [Flavobacteriaceae bacterium]